jgi:hypothetical protein
MNSTFAVQDLEAYLDEALPPAEMARIEEAARGNLDLCRQLALIQSRRDSGVHSLGGIWRRHRLSCPTREQLGSYLLGVLADDQSDYLRFHLDAVGCRYCQANLADLCREHGDTASADTSSRRRKYFQSSAGYLRPAR